LIISSFINAVFYIIIYSYLDKILEILEGISLSAVAVNYIRLASLLIVGFCIGVIVMLVLKLKLKRSLFSFKNLLIVGFFPFICIILSEGTITSFIINKFFNSSEQLSELAFYLFSRQSIWSLWLGFSIGSSIRFSFSKREYKHVSMGVKEDAGSLLVKDSETKKQGHNHSPEY
jgi:hypothetical protein